MKRLFYIYYVIFLVLFFSFPVLSADVIEMTNGKRYKGVILDYDQGLFFIKINGKKHFLLEDEISRIKWNSSDAELNEALKGETFKLPASRWGHLKLSAITFFETVVFFDEAYSKVYNNTLSHLGFGIGVKNVTKFSQGAWISFMYNTSSGNISYNYPHSDLQEQTKIETSRLFFMFNALTGIDLFSGLPFELYCDFAVGAAQITDKLKSYPVISNEDWIWPPPEVEMRPMTKSYLTFAGRISVGTHFGLADFLDADFGLGFFGMVQKSYENPDEIDDWQFESDFVKGVSFKAGLRFII